MIRIKKQRNGLFRLIQNIDRKRERLREGGGRSSHRTLKQAVALKAANVTCAANNTELMNSAATGQQLTGDNPIVRPQLTASEQQA